MREEIPPYQAIDLLLGLPGSDTTPPEEGWAITHPTLGAEMFEKEEDADRRISEIACSSVKWPHQTSKFRAWIHQKENKRYWTLR